MTARWRIAVLAVLVVAVAVGTTFVLTRPRAEQSQAVAALTGATATIAQLVDRPGWPGPRPRPGGPDPEGPAAHRRRLLAMAA